MTENEFVTIARREDIEKSVLSSRGSCSLSLALEKIIKWYYRSTATRDTDFLQLITGLCFLHCRDDFNGVSSRVTLKENLLVHQSF